MTRSLIFGATALAQAQTVYVRFHVVEIQSA